MTSNKAALIGCLFLVGCGGGATQQMVTQLHEPEPIRTGGTFAADSGTTGCVAEDSTPAVIETVTEQVLVTPATRNDDGSVAVPAIYRTDTRQKIVHERIDQTFERICEADLTPDFIATLQRALAARGLYEGPIDGLMSAATQKAIRAYQEPQGLDSAIPSLAAARQLGLVQVERIEG